MPGIAGIVSSRPPNQCELLLASMAKSMLHESFYAVGTHSAPDLGVYGAAVAFREQAPAGGLFLNGRGDVALLFSGGGIDGAALIKRYEDEGERSFAELNGLFSGLLLDRRSKRGFLFNDRYGFDRVYVHQTENELYFASEAKALLRVLPKLRAFSEEGVADFLAVGCPTNGRTLFRGVELLPGGSVWTLRPNGIDKRRYFTPETWEAQPPLSAAEFSAAFEREFKAVLPRYYDSPPRLGISLTAGLDTRMIMACRQSSEGRPVCYTYDGSDGETLDTRLAARIAGSCGMEHHTLRIQPDFLSDFAAQVDRTVFVTDGASGVLGAHEIYLTTKARELAPVRLTGVFGSEVLRGVSTFKPLSLAANLFEPEVARLVSRAESPRARSSGNAVSHAAFAEIPWNLFGGLAACRSQVTFRTPYLDNKIVALAYRVPPQLRNSSEPARQLIMRNDPQLGAIPTDMGLRASPGSSDLFRRVWSKVTFKLDYLSNEGLPDQLSRFDRAVDALSARKLVFGQHKYLRYRSWFRNELGAYLRDAFADAQQASFWNRAFLEGMAERHISGRQNLIREINAVLTLRAVERLLFSASACDSRDPADLVGV